MFAIPTAARRIVATAGILGVALGTAAPFALGSVRPDDRAEPRGPGVSGERSLAANDGITAGDLRSAGLVFGVSSPGVGILTRDEVMRLLERRSTVSDPASVRPDGRAEPRGPGAADARPPLVVVGHGGFDWRDAGIGAGAALGAGALAAAGALALRQRRVGEPTAR